jgi:hypothetical protein
VIAYYLISDLQFKSLLIRLRNLEGPYLGENIAVCVLAIIAEYEISDLIKYFVSDNVSSNDVAINVIYRELKLAHPVIRRLRCLDHIINLAAKAFLYEKEEGSFDFEISDTAKIKLEVRQALELLVF